MFFPDNPIPIETVREIAALLKANDLGEIVLKSTGDGPKIRLLVKRPSQVVMQVAQHDVSPVEFGDNESEAGMTEIETPAALAQSEVLAPCVGVFRAPKKVLQVGDMVKARQIVGVIESLHVPNEVYASVDGQVIEILASEGQGVEWGQTLLVLEPTL